MSTIAINNFHNIEILNLEYLGNDEWSQSWGTVGSFGLWQNHYYHFGARVRYLLPLDINNNNHHLLLTLSFTFGDYQGDYLIYAYDEVNNIHTLKATKNVTNNSFVIDLLHEAHYENGCFTFYISTPYPIEQFCMVSVSSISLMIDYDDNYRKITHVYNANITDTLVYASSNYGQRFSNAYNKPSHDIDVFYPDGFNPNTSYPVVITLHGGGWSIDVDTNGTINYNHRGDYQNNISFLTKETGSIVVSMEYRLLVFENGATDSWHADDGNTSIHDRELYADNYLDMLIDLGRAISYIKAFMPYINQNKIYLMGYSAGGHIALLYGFSASQQIDSSLVHNIVGIIAEAAPYAVCNFEYYEIEYDYSVDLHLDDLLYGCSNNNYANPIYFTMNSSGIIPNFFYAYGKIYDDNILKETDGLIQYNNYFYNYFIINNYSKAFISTDSNQQFDHNRMGTLLSYLGNGNYGDYNADGSDYSTDIANFLNA